MLSKSASERGLPATQSTLDSAESRRSPNKSCSPATSFIGTLSTVAGSELRPSTVQVHLRLTCHERDELVRMAYERDQTLSAVVRYLIRRYRADRRSNGSSVHAAASR
jgi:hypothetical protein